MWDDDLCGGDGEGGDKLDAEGEGTLPDGALLGVVILSEFMALIRTWMALV
jgi:hypothetical protein